MKDWMIEEIKRLEKNETGTWQYTVIMWPINIKG